MISLHNAPATNISLQLDPAADSIARVHRRVIEQQETLSSMKSLYLWLKAPSEITIFRPIGDGNRDPSIHGRVSIDSPEVSQSSGVLVQIQLVRFGALKTTHEANNNTTPWRRRMGLGSKSQSDILDLGKAERLAQCSVNMTSTGSGLLSSTFELVVPSSLPPSMALPSIEISYALVATSTTPSGQNFRTQQVLRISKRWLEPPHLLPSTKITFPESPLSVKARFGKQDLRNRHLPITLHLKGLDSPSSSSTSVPSVSWIRECEVKKMTPRTIQWELEEKTVSLSGPSSDGSSITMSDTTRLEQVQTISKGKYQPILHYPFKTSSDTTAESEFEVQFNAQTPKDTELPHPDELSTIASRLENTILYAHPCPGSGSQHEQSTRFAMFTEHTLRICIHMGEDTFHKATGSLVNRKPAQFAYTVLVPLRSARESRDGGQGDMTNDLPAYEAEGGSSPIYSLL
ncbi:hypothetical protein EK21DRAFT_90637 [Setomelanomma holmii]|uniref:LDB19 N-terminal domain-containing protein n=1 Tax=Setomelanomma holmii TaxID=210430 RepID=A0A9P4H5I2_9PLEO|nr:hypothetical protein EK21DRAFT_90637 [Setomelanomma holmii]